MNVLEFVWRAVRSPRAAARDLASASFMVGGIAVVLVVALVAMIVSSILAMLAGAALTSAARLLGFESLPGQLIGSIVVGGTLIPTFVVTVMAYRRLPSRLQDGLPPDPIETTGSPPFRTEPKLDLAALDARLAVPSSTEQLEAERHRGPIA